MAGPTVIVDLEKVEHNARTVTGLCADHGISVSAVTKVTCGMPRVARALLRGGASGIGESRLENIHRLKSNGIVAEMMLLRIPPLSGADEIVRTVDISLNSELSVIRALSKAALEHGIVHRILMMIDLGDLREGFWPDDVIPAAREIVELPNITLAGVGTNLTCYGGVIPTRENMQMLVDWARRIEDVTGTGLEIVSGGNSSSLPLLASGEMPEGVNHLRIGEGILLGRETVDRSPWPGTVQDAFRLEAEIIELKEKPSVPIGRTGQDAFGNRPQFEDRGERLRAILNVGREDVDVEGLTPVDERRSILGASSDHLLVDMGPAARAARDDSSVQEEDEGAGAGAGMFRLGDTLEFIMNYSALLAAMTSSYVEKRTVKEGAERFETKKLRFFGGSLVGEEESAFARTLRSIGFHIETEPVDTDEPGPFRRELRDCVLAGDFPLISGRRHRSAEAFSAFAEAVEDAGLLWISPYASITSTYSESDVLGRLLGEGSVVADEGGRGERRTPPPSRETRSSAAPNSRPALISPGADNLVLLGLREADEREVEVIRGLGITAFTMEDVDRTGIQGVVRKALQRAVVGTRGLYIYFDERLSDNGQEGLTTRETHMMMELIAGTGFMRALDVSGGRLGGRERRKLQQFVSSALGKRILG
jgi:predicted amino acid racemase